MDRLKYCESIIELQRKQIVAMMKKYNELRDAAVAVINNPMQVELDALKELTKRPGRPECE